MPLTVPNESAAPVNSAQATLYQADIDAIIASIVGNGVLNGCAVTAQGTPNNTVAVAAGAVRIAGATVIVAAGNVTMPTADGTNPMWVLITVSNAGTKTATAGTAAASPLLPAIPAEHVTLAAVWWPASDTTVASNQITDKRVLLAGRPFARPKAGSNVGYSQPGLATYSNGLWSVGLPDGGTSYYPLEFARRCRIDRLAVYVDDLVGSNRNFRIGLYLANGDMQPTSLLVDGGALTATATGWMTATVDVWVDPGIILGTIHNESYFKIGTTLANNLTGTHHTLVSDTYISNLWEENGSYGALPSTGIAWDSWNTSYYGFYNGVWVRISELG